VRRVLVLGATGMLGSTVAAVLGEEPSLAVVAVDRTRFDALHEHPGPLLADERPDWVVNAIGITAANIDEDDRDSVARAEVVNLAFPRRLAAAAEQLGVSVLQISTDGIFSGSAGPYDEDAAPDPAGVYARTKLAGEIPNTLRCSIVGVEPPGGTSLVAWVLSQPHGATIDGFVNHRWNGVSTKAFADVCWAVTTQDIELPSPLHLVPADVVTKAELVALIAGSFGRDDLEIRAVEAPRAVDRTLATRHPDAVAALWRAAGYAEAPTVAAMIADLGRSTSMRDRS
jgi:dTDP-4-dehydrorhamnose reductase